MNKETLTDVSFDQLDTIVRRCGVRGTLNILADVIEKAASESGSLLYDNIGESDHSVIYTDDLLTISGNLRKDMY